jgi:hypothetical protein
MTRSFLTLIAVTAASLIGSNPTAAQQIPGGEEAESVQIIIGPALESVAEKSAIVRWMSTTPPGAAEHFGVVHYGTDPNDLSQTAKFLNSHLARSLIFRTYAGASVFRFRLGFRSPVIRSFQFERAGLASVCKQWRHRLYRCNPLLR